MRLTESWALTRWSSEHIQDRGLLDCSTEIISYERESELPFSGWFLCRISGFLPGIESGCPEHEFEMDIREQIPFNSELHLTIHSGSLHSSTTLFSHIRLNEDHPLYTLSACTLFHSSRLLWQPALWLAQQHLSQETLDLMKSSSLGLVAARRSSRWLITSTYYFGFFFFFFFGTGASSISPLLLVFSRQLMKRY